MQQRLEETGFRFTRGRVIARRFEVVEQLGSGYESEVYLLRECTTGIERAGKFFYPARNPRDITIRRHAKRLHKLRHCPMVAQYHAQDAIVVRGEPVSFLVSEFVEGEPLTDFLAKQPGNRLTPFAAVHLLHALATGLELIHTAGEYHGDLHTDNVMVQRYGLAFHLKILDFYHWKNSRKTELVHHDIIEMVRIFYQALGGARYYARQPPVVKEIIRGMKHSLILERFRSAGRLRRHLESMRW